MEQEEQHTQFWQNTEWRSLGDFAHSLAEEKKRWNPAFTRKKARVIEELRVVIHAQPCFFQVSYLSQYNCFVELGQLTTLE